MHFPELISTQLRLFVKNMAVSNVQRLTRGDRKYAAKKSSNKVEEVKFDPESRKDFLTGFHKRKLARQAEGKRRAEELNRQQRLAERRRIREERRKDIDAGLGRLKEAEDIINGGRSEDDETTVSSSKHAEFSLEPRNADDLSEDEFNGFEETSGILKRREVNYGNSTVTFEEINLDPYVDISRSEQVLDEATRKANEYAAYVSSLEAAEAEAKKKAQKAKVKKFRYLPKSERKFLNRKNKVR